MESQSTGGSIRVTKETFNEKKFSGDRMESLQRNWSHHDAIDSVSFRFDKLSTGYIQKSKCKGDMKFYNRLQIIS